MNSTLSSLQMNTESKRAERFLQESCSLLDEHACLIYLLSLAFASADLTALKALPDPPVDGDRFGAVALNSLILNRSITDEALEKIVTGQLKGLA
jgi:hypothetical protein